MQTAATPALPPHENLRLDALRRYEVLDTPAEQAYDELAWLAGLICEAPVALVSLVDSDRQWFKAHCGHPGGETARAISFCGHAILQPDQVMEVPDATQDPRFVENPFVTGPDHLRFYAGAPLVTPDGLAVGTLCVFDTRPRTLAEEQRRALQALARQVVTQLELRRLALSFQHQSAVDPLTQIWNRRAFDQRYAEEWVRHTRRCETMGLLLVDVDRFKEVNDQLGHPEGDRVLTQVAQVVGDALRSTDHLSRYGGEEFVAILPSTGVNAAVPVAQRVRQAVERHDWGARGVTISIGLAAMVPSKSGDPQQLLKRADHALLQAKRRGRNRVEAFSGWSDY